MIKGEQLYEGRAKKVFATDDPEILMVSYKDDATAFNGLKKGTISGKGVINNKMSNMLMQLLEKDGIPTHFVEELNDRETLVKKATIIPMEVIVRNIAAGSFSKRFGMPEGVQFKKPTVEFSYKDDDLDEPLMNDDYVLVIGLANEEEIARMRRYALAVNRKLQAVWDECGVILVDFKLEFGRLADGTIVLTDEISPDTCRLWDKETHEKLDKDRFRRSMGGVEAAYEEVMRRLTKKL